MKLGYVQVGSLQCLGKPIKYLILTYKTQIFGGEWIVEADLICHWSGLMATIIKNGLRNQSSNHGQGYLYFTKHYYSWERYEFSYSPSRDE